MEEALFAADKASWRVDADGRLHIALCRISKATVNPYYGREIPNCEALGLDPSRVYRMWRPAEELAKAAPTFNNIQVLSKHVAVSVDAPQEMLVAGSTGTDAVFTDPYLMNSIVIWRAEDIEAIKTRERCEWSCSYRYEPDMTPGLHGSEKYDGIMRNIIANHVAQIAEGRAGPDVNAYDERSVRMPLSPTAKLARAAITGYLRPRMKPGTVLALDTALSSITAANAKAKRTALIADVLRITAPVLAFDAKAEEVEKALDWMDDDEDDAEDKAKDEAEETEAEKAAREAAAAKDKRARDKKARDKAKDSDPDDKEEDKAKAKADDTKAMDAMVAGIRAEVMAQMQAAAEAREAVRPHVGQVSLAMDSAEAIYKFALEARGVKVAGIHPSAYPAMVGMLAKAGGSPRPLAMDGAPKAIGIEARFPVALHIRTH